MSDLANAGFETKAADPAPVGRADGWAIDLLSSVVDYAQFAINVPAGYEGEGRETFELGWPDDAQLVTLPDAALATLAAFGPRASPRLYEAFERLWEVPPSAGGPPLGTAHSIPTLVHAEAAEFDGTTHEGFWWSTAPLDFEATDLEGANFWPAAPPGDEYPFETFEFDWRNNSMGGGAWWSWSTVSDEAAVFVGTVGGGTFEYENIKLVADRFLVTDVDLSTNEIFADYSAAPLQVDNDVEFLTAAGVPATEDRSAELPRLPTPLRYGQTYYVTANISATFIGGVALGPGGADIPLTAKGGGEFYIARSRLTHWRRSWGIRRTTTRSS